MNRNYWLSSVVVSVTLWAGQSVAKEQIQQTAGGYTLEQLKEQSNETASTTDENGEKIIIFE